MTLRFGIHSGQQHTDFASYVALWQEAEALGLDWASAFDHFVPIQSDPTGPCFEGMTLLSAMAAHTSRMRIGMIVVGVTYRHPAILANEVATIDHVSGGRLEFGLGAAWFELEHQQYGIAFPRIGQRMDMLDEACRVVRSLWTNETTTFEGRHFQLSDARCEPKPVQAHLPLWIGGTGERRTLRIAAEHADGWNMFLTAEDEYRHKLDVLARHCADVGRDPAEIRKQLVFRAVLGEDEAEARERGRKRAAALGIEDEQFRAQWIVGTPEQCAERLSPYVALGVGDLLLFSRPPGDPRTMELIARGVAPRFELHDLRSVGSRVRSAARSAAAGRNSRRTPCCDAFRAAAVPRGGNPRDGHHPWGRKQASA
jgi:F420-dependent oxidoreductase-like protein